MIRNRTIHLALLLVLICFPAVAFTLPQPLLQKAREAEKLAGGGQLKHAISSYQKLDREFPGHAPLSLRLAQLHDQISRPGEALFYYRRYAARATGGVREEARERMVALELVPGASQTAEELAKQLKEKTAPVPVPTPAVRVSIAAVGDDGLLRPLNGPDDLKRLQRGEDIPVETPALGQPAAALPASLTGKSAVAEQGSPSASVGAPSPVAAAPVAPQPAGDEDAALAAAIARRTTGEPTPFLSSSTTRTVIVLPERRVTPAVEIFSQADAAPVSEIIVPPASVPSATPGRLIIEDAGGAPAPSLSGLEQAIRPSGPRQAFPARGPGFSAPASGSAVDRSGLFTIKRAGGVQAQLKLANTVDESILTFAAVPDTGATPPVNAVLTPGEVRTLYVQPGSYEVVISATTNDYAPRTLLDRRIEYEFAAGFHYTLRLTPELTQGLQ